MIILPNQALSWQYHTRREEVWKVIVGPVGTIISNTDELTDPVIHQADELIFIQVNQRHRLIGLDNIAIVAELWVHTDEHNLSNELDIVRVRDDYGRQ